MPRVSVELLPDAPAAEVPAAGWVADDSAIDTSSASMRSITATRGASWRPPHARPAASALRGCRARDPPRPAADDTAARNARRALGRPRRGRVLGWKLRDARAVRARPGRAPSTAQAAPGRARDRARLQELRDRGVLRLQTDIRARYPNLAQPRPEHALAGDESRPARRAALLTVRIGEPHPLVCDSVDVRRPIPHQPIAIATQIRDPNVVAPDHKMSASKFPAWKHLQSIGLRVTARAMLDAEPADSPHTYRVRTTGLRWKRVASWRPRGRAARWVATSAATSRASSATDRLSGVVPQPRIVSRFPVAEGAQLCRADLCRYEDETRGAYRSLCECRSRMPSSRSPRRPDESSARPLRMHCWPACETCRRARRSPPSAS